jgi:hypothetical protein
LEQRTGVRDLLGSPVAPLPSGVKYGFPTRTPFRHGENRGFVSPWHLSGRVLPNGTSLAGSVGWDEGTKLTGVILSVRKVASPDDPPNE